MTIPEHILSRRAVKFTFMRRKVYDLLCQCDQPMTAYHLMGLLEDKLCKKLGPPQIYRALSFLLKQRLVARIESHNAYIAFPRPREVNPLIFFVCQNCGWVGDIENPALEQMLIHDAKALGFNVTNRVIELHGICIKCQGIPEHAHKIKAPY